MEYYERKNLMPTYDHICLNENCKFEWDDFYSITAEPPKVCPKCNQETAQRVISGGSGKGIVELTGNELKEKVKADAQQLKKDMHKSEKTYSNLLGESKYQQMQQKIDAGKKIFRRK